MRNILLDLFLTGMALVIFALFHHVLPRAQQSLEIVIENHAAAEEQGMETVSGESSGTVTHLAETFTPASGASSGKKTGGGNAGRGSGRGGMNSKGGSSLKDGEETAETEADEPVSEKFSEMYTDTVIRGENSYTSPDLSVTVTRHVTEDGETTYYLADIYLRDVTCLRTALANDQYGRGFRDTISSMASLHDALLAVNGDYYGNTDEGVVIRNGVIYRANPTDCDVCVLYYDGSMRVMDGAAFSVEDAVTDGAWQAWTFGPSLLSGEGEALDSFSSTQRIISVNPRTAIGYYEKGHYCLMVVDGRGESRGITLPELSRLFESLGCRAAYNLDGGNSSVMVWDDAVINDPSGGGRASSDAILIMEAM